MKLTLLHTAEIHCATFDAMRDRVAPGQELRHVVRKSWLKRAQAGDAAVTLEVADAIAAAQSPVLCTCTTIGPVSEAAGATRVDWPMMRAAAATGGPVMIAYTQDSTWEPSLALLERALAEADTPARVYPLRLTRYWPLFEAGEHQAFHAVVAGEIRRAAPQLEGQGCVILAQVSMAGAASLLSDLDVPVLSSPESALKAALGLI